MMRYYFDPTEDATAFAPRERLAKGQETSAPIWRPSRGLSGTLRHAGRIEAVKYIGPAGLPRHIFCRRLPVDFTNIGSLVAR